jgi:hypothetical protein
VRQGAPPCSRPWGAPPSPSPSCWPSPPPGAPRGPTTSRWATPAAGRRASSRVA